VAAQPIAGVMRGARSKLRISLEAQDFFVERAGQDLWYHLTPSFTWLPFLRIRCLHFGHVPILALLVVESVG
jgi:hypothetical protein